MDDIIDELSWRGLLADTTDLGELRAALGSGRVTFYAGFDPTAPGLHIGNLALLLTMRRLQLAGHRPIGLVGGATGLIGDPSGKSAERVLNPREVVAQWVERIRGEVSRFLDFDAGESSALVVSNLDWTGDMHVLDFLRDIGKHFSVNRMLDRESVKARLEAGGISYTEFSYQLLQAMDYLELYRRYGCSLQLGGSDQWGNLVAGVDLIRRTEGSSVHALAIPLVTKADGTKYGKTEGGAIWISADLMPPYAFYQFWLNVADAEVPGLLRVYSFKSREEIEALIAESVERPAARAAQRALAEEVTTLVHGAEETRRVIEASRAVFGQAEPARIDQRTWDAVAGQLPTVRWSVGVANASHGGAVQTLIYQTPSESAQAESGGAASTLTTRPSAGSNAAHGGAVSAIGNQAWSGSTPEGPAPAANAPSAAPSSIAHLMVGAGTVPTLSAARRAIVEGGVYLNNKRVTSVDAVVTSDDLFYQRYALLRRGKRTVAIIDARDDEET